MFILLVNAEVIGFIISLGLIYLLEKSCEEQGLNEGQEFKDIAGVILTLSLFWWLWWPYFLYRLYKAAKEGGFDGV